MDEATEWAKVVMLLWVFAGVMVLYVIIAVGRIWMYTKETTRLLVKILVVLEKQVDIMESGDTIETESLTGSADVYERPTLRV